MLQWKSNRAAFTLIELLVVVIIVAVLAAVGVPLLSANVLRARTSEADAALGTIRTGMRALFAEKTSYATAALPTSTTDDGNLGTTWADLCGRYFSANDFAIVTATASTYCVKATGSGIAAGAVCPANAPRENQVSGVTHAIDQNGHIYNAAACTDATKILN